MHGYTKYQTTVVVVVVVYRAWALVAALLHLLDSVHSFSVGSLSFDAYCFFFSVAIHFDTENRGGTVDIIHQIITGPQYRRKNVDEQLGDIIVC